jgi:hypothetical protein
LAEVFTLSKAHGLGVYLTQSMQEDHLHNSISV